MYSLVKCCLCLCVTMNLSISNIFSQSFSEKNSVRPQIDLTASDWKVWMDQDALWENDSLYLPDEIDLKSIPANPPTCGWKELDKTGIPCNIPASIEEIFSKGINSWTYHGVSWFWASVKIPEDWKGKTVKLNIRKARLRVEIYVNQELAGYDIIAETPIEVDISEFVRYGKTNQIAIRLTNPGGNRGWEDFPGISWGKYKLPASHDFSGIDGKVTLTALNEIHIQNIFVKNVLPVNGKKIEVITTLNSPGKSNNQLKYNLNIYPFPSGESIYSESWAGEPDSNNRISKVIVAEQAKLWNIDTPELYYCEFSVYSGSELLDKQTERFGFRTFEAKVVDKQHNFYLNGKRVRFRSAIDWGYYALTGFYASDEMAKKSVEAAKAIGHNAINFHRRIGEPLVMDYADELGLYFYEEPGGFHGGFQTYTIRPNTFTAKIMEEKCRRMVIRDRNHPGLMVYNLCNEDFFWNELREKVMRMIHDLDGTRLVCNSSGWLNINHMRPYEDTVRLDYIDDHTIESTARFNEKEFSGHEIYNDSNLIYWGEVRCYTGPSNWYNCARLQEELPNNNPGYDLNIYKPLHDKIVEFFDQNDFENIGSKNIKSYSDVTKQAGRGLMYINGRVGQIIMSYNCEDGYAINGWSEGPHLPDEWASAIVDEGRNLKGPASDYNYWIREKQIAVFRQNGKYFNPADTAKFDFHLINEGKIEAGKYFLKVKIKDGKGKYVAVLFENQIEVEGGDTYAQKLFDDIEVAMKEEWNAGHISVEAELYKDDLLITNGIEQVLLRNRKSYYDEFAKYKGAVINWLPAQMAILETGNQISEYSDTLQGHLDYILAGYLYKDSNDDKVYKPINMAHVEDIFNRVYKDGTVLLLRFGEHWADYLFEKGILSKIPREWRGWQTDGWNGNGWGYLDHFTGDQAVPSITTISTNSWEVDMDGIGFYPFESEYPQAAYGAFFARHNDLVTTLGTIKYGKGIIILDSSFWVDYNKAFNDMLFYNLISVSVNELRKD